jgi:putative ribosome biogenesis GTPase RsgA
MTALLVEDTLMATSDKTHHRLNIDVEIGLHQQLKRANARDRISMADRVRQLLILSLEDPELNERVVARAAADAEERIAES